MSITTSITEAALITTDGVFSLLVNGEWIDISHVNGCIWLRADAFRVPPARTAADLAALIGAPVTDISRSCKVDA